MIEFHNVTKRFEGGYEALSNVTLSLGDGEMAFITGHSGAYYDCNDLFSLISIGQAVT